MAEDSNTHKALKQENRLLKKELERLHGKLGAAALAIMREEKYQALEAELKHMYNEVEKAQADKEGLRDKAAIAAMQGILAKPTSDIVGVFVAGLAYEMADAMLVKREEKK